MKSDSQIQFLKELGKNLRAIRNANCLSMEQLAGDANIEFRQLGRIERGETNATILTLRKLADALGVELADLMPTAGNARKE